MLGLHVEFVSSDSMPSVALTRYGTCCKPQKKWRYKNGHFPRILRSVSYHCLGTLVAKSVLGLGALSAPFIATQFAQLRHWSFHYLVTLGIAVLNTISLSTIFGAKTQDGKVRNSYPSNIG